MTMSESTITSMKQPAHDVTEQRNVKSFTDSISTNATVRDAIICSAPQTTSHDFLREPMIGTESETIPQMNLSCHGIHMKVM